MENYDAIIKCINDTLKDKESSLNYYREEMPKRDARIRELEESVAEFQSALIDERDKNNKLTTELDRLKEHHSTLFKAYEALKTKNCDIENS